ncbi:MAG: 2-C-methyl-D-erythritol 2,4-cyclodiphosphate synthase [Flavobacteriales bacterium]
MYRVGFGFDVHQLENGKPFFLGGVEVLHTSGAVGHSDADVIIHAICDAILGAAHLRDIGFHFPNNDAKYRGIDSKILLALTADKLKASGWELVNLDCTLCLEKPKIQEYIPRMESTLCEIMKCPGDAISIKATTNEKMGFVGREEGVCAYAVAMIQKIV